VSGEGATEGDYAALQRPNGRVAATTIFWPSSDLATTTLQTKVVIALGRGGRGPRGTGRGDGTDRGGRGGSSNDRGSFLNRGARGGIRAGTQEVSFRMIRVKKPSQLFSCFISPAYTINMRAYTTWTHSQ
jgi:hypothetical protein